MLAPYAGLQDNPLAAGEACTLDNYAAPASVNDEHWGSVVLLLETNGANGGTTFTDSSPVARTPTTVSNVQTSTTQTKFGTASMVATAGSPILEYDFDTDFQFPGSGTWTIEFWIYLTTTSGTQKFLGQRSGTGKYFQVASFGTLSWLDDNGTAISFGTLRTGHWTHCALTCDGTNIRAYKSAARTAELPVASYTDATVTDFSIISAGTDWATNYFKGYLTGIRITQGVARYRTESYTIPTAAFPTAVETTWLDDGPRTVCLLQFEPRQNTSIFSAPGTSDAADATTYGGETATPTVQDATAVSYGAGGFTFTVDTTDNRILYTAASKFFLTRYRECALRCTVSITGTPTASAAGKDIVQLGYTIASPSFGWALNCSAGGALTLFCSAYDNASNGSTGQTITSPGTYELELRFTENGDYLWLIDGAVVRTYIAQSAYIPPSELSVGPQSGTVGGLSGFTMTVSSLRLETYPPLDRVLYRPKYVRPIASAALSNAEAKFGTHALAVPGASDGYLTEWHDDFLMGSLDWTVECWAYRTSNAAVGALFTCPGSTSFSPTVGTDGLIDVSYRSSGGTTDVTDIAEFTLNTWHHVALQRNGNTYELFLDGELIDSTAVPGSAAQGTSAALYVGRDTSGDGFAGYIDEFRVTKGLARYSDPFTPATSGACSFGGDATPPDTTLQPPASEPIAFSAVTRASLFGVVGGAISSTTLATITCADADMTVSVSHAIPGLTFSYSANVLSVSGTPTGPSSFTRVVVSYIASDGSNSVRGSTEHEITIVDASEVLTIGSMAGAAGRVGVPLSATLASPSTNYEVDVRIAANSAIAGLAPSLAWTIGSGSASGTLTLAGTPTLAGTYSLEVDYYGFGVLIGTSTHEVVIASAYRPAPPAPSPSPAPPAPSPSPPPAPTPAPAPGRGPDSLFAHVKVLMHFDTATGLATDVKGNTFTNQGVTSGTGAVAQGGVFTSATTTLEATVSGIDGADGDLTVEAMVDIDATAWSALMDGAIFGNRFCPVVTLLDSAGAVVWTLGFASAPKLTGTPGRYVVPTMFNSLTGEQFGFPAGNQCAVTHAYPDLYTRPGRFVHLAMTRRGNPVSPTDNSYDQGTWFDGAAGGQRRVPYLDLLKTAPSGTLRIGGVCPQIEYVIASVASRNVQIVPFSGVIDELRITAYQRYVSYLFPGLLAQGQQVSAIPDHARVIPWPNY